ncbi:MAG: site-specific DNA-methyltransferase [Anaerolineales bacterium]|jgi:DNA modification methylase
MKGKRKRKPFARLVWDHRREERPQPASLALQGKTFPSAASPQTDAQLDRLILGDNLGVMASLLSELEGQIDLIYADPPFLTGKAYAARVGRNEDSRRPSEWQTIAGYQDTWKDGAEYLDMLYPRLRLMYQLLSPTGTLYLHLDWHASAYARVLLDEIFGPNRLLNEIIWAYHGPSPIRSAFKRKHDTILSYTKSSRYTFNADAVRVAYDPSTIKTFASSRAAGFGKVPDLERGKVPEDWWYFPVVARLHHERTGYPTQKPQALMERIILASSHQGDLVADFFCGSGTTAVAASRLGRRWIACDATPLAILTTYRRLLLQPERKPFSLWQDRAAPFKSTLRPSAAIKISGKDVTVDLTALRGSSAPHADFPQNLILWEVDWDFDQSQFRSQSQAVRPFRKNYIALQQCHTYATPGQRLIAIRATDSVGKHGLLTEPISIK